MKESFTPRSIARISINSIKVDSSLNPIKIDCVGCKNSRYFGTWYDKILKDELERLNHENLWTVSDNMIYKYVDYCDKKELSVDSIYNRINEYRSIRENYDAVELSKHLYSLLVNVDYSLFKSKKIFAQNPVLRAADIMGSHIKPDIIIDDRIIDIKTYDKVKIKREDLVQLIAYAIWFDNRHILYPPEDKSKRIDGFHYNNDIRFYDDKLEINEIGIFFSKHNYLWTKKLSGVWMSEGRRFCIEHKNSKNFKQFLHKVIERVMVDEPKKTKKLF